MKIIDFGLSDYETIWQQQKQLVEKRLLGEIPDTILIGEHPPVITLGRGTHKENILAPQAPVVEIERGGDITYHGPGQLIAYPIILLPEGRRDLHRYLRDLEEAIILTLAEFGIEGTRETAYTGVWIQTADGPRKLASIGVAVKKWVTYHGLALNVNTDLTAFTQMNPCGLSSEVMTSMQALQSLPLTTDAIKPILLLQLEKTLVTH